MSTPAIDYESIAKQYGGEPAQDYASIAKQYGGEPLAPPAQQDIHTIAAQHGGLPLTAAGPEDMSTVAGAIPNIPVSIPAPPPAQPDPSLAPDLSWQEKLKESIHAVAPGLTDTWKDQPRTITRGLAPLPVKPAAPPAQTPAPITAGPNMEGFLVQSLRLAPPTLKPLPGGPEALAGEFPAGTPLGEAERRAYTSPLTWERQQAVADENKAERTQALESAWDHVMPRLLPTSAETAEQAALTPEEQKIYDQDKADVAAGRKAADQKTAHSKGVPVVNTLVWNRGQGAEDDKSFREHHPNVAAMKDAVQDKLSGFSRADQMAILAAIPQSKLISIYFGVQMGKGAVQGASQTVEDIKAGDHRKAVYDATGALLDATMAGLAGHHAASTHAMPTSESSPETNPTTDETKPAIGETEPETGRPILQQSENPEVNQAAAKSEHPIVKSQLADAVKPIEGAELAGARAEKDPDRVGEKIEDEGQSPRTVRDYSGYRIAVDTPEAKNQVVKALKDHFEVPDEQDEFEKGNDETGFHGHTLQVREPGSPVSHEVQILPREVADSANSRHDLYEKAREGDKDAAAQMKAANEADWQRFLDRNGKLIDVPLKGATNALREQGSGSLLQRPQAGDGETGGERGRVEPIKQGEGPARAQKAGETAVQPTDQEFQKGSRVRLKDGQTGTVQYFQPEVNGGQAVARVRLDSGEMRKSVQASDMWPEASEPETKGKQWIGVDLDGTLAKYDGFKGPTVIGAPISAMVDRVKQWLAEGKNVKILTARVSEDASGVAKRAIQDWAEKNLGQRIDVTDVKDAHMVHLYDDRAVPVERNTGRLLGQPQPEESNVVRQTTVPEGNTETAGNAERPTPDETVRRNPEERGVDTELSEARRLGKQSSDKVLAGAQARNAVENIARARIETTTLKDLGNAKVTVLNPDAYHSLVKLLTPEDGWKGAALDPSTASRWIAKIRSMESRLRQLGTMRPAAEAAKALALDLDKAREADGSLLLLRSDYEEPTVREELAHRWQNQAGLRDSEAIRELTNRPEFEQINDRLKSMGYDLSPEDQASELLAKAMAGDPDMEWSLTQQKDVVSAGLKAAVDERGPSILENLPPTDPAIKSAIEEAKTYAKDKVRGNEREASKRLGGERGGEARADRGQRGGTVDQGKPSAGAGGERGVQKGRAAEDQLGRFKKLASEVRRIGVAPPRDTGALFKRAVDRDKESREPKGPWYLKSQKIIDRKMTGPMPVDALLKMLQNNGVKPEELKWSGLEDLAKENRKVTPDEAREYIAANSLELKEVTKGDQPQDYEEKPAEPARTPGRYASYVLPGGENYREMLLTLPDKGLRGLSGDGPRDVRVGNLQRRLDQVQEALQPLIDDPEQALPNWPHEAELERLNREHRRLTVEIQAEERGAAAGVEDRNFRSGHWDEPNVLGHVRFNDRTGPNGEKLLHLEELQSDWHQKGRTQGYESDDVDTARKTFQTATAKEKELRAVVGLSPYPEKNDLEALRLSQTRTPYPPTQKRIEELEAISKTDAYRAWQDAVRERDKAAGELRKLEPGKLVPDAPFKKTWPELLMKRMLRYAAENGYDGISWTPGEQQAERYDLSKQLDHIHYWEEEENSKGEKSYGLSAASLGSDYDDVFDQYVLSESKLEDTVGKEVAKKIVAGEGENEGVGPGVRTLRGDDLKVGGEGMKGFYDKIVPDLANKLGKPFGAKVDETQLDLPEGNKGAKIASASLGRFNVVDDNGQTLAGPFDTKREAQNHLDDLRKSASELTVPYLPIPDAMRESVMQGQPLFKRTDRPTTVTTGKHDTGKSLKELIADLAKAPKRSMSMEERIESASDYGLRSIAGVGDKLNQTWAKLKGSTAGIWDSWNQPSPWTNFFESLKGLRQAEFTTALDLDAYQKELKRTVPSQREREAMTIYGEAKDDQELRRWASQADNLPDKRWANAFKDAIDLTPQQKAIATDLRKYYDQKLQILTDSGLLPAGATRYVMHMFTSDPQTLQQLRSITDFSELATDPSFLKRRVYKNYFEAIAKGEKPKTLDAGLILGAYHDAFEKTFMTRSFLRSLLYAADEDDGRPLAAIQSRAGWTMLDKDQAGEARILKQPKRPEDLTGYKVIPASQLRNFTWELTDADREILAPGYKDMPKDEQAKLFGPDDPRFPVPAGKTLAIKGDLLIHPKYADRVSDLVTKSWFDRSDSKVAAALKGVQKSGAVAKSVVLSGSLFHQVQLGVHAMEHLVNPFKLPELKALAKDPVVLEGVGHGLNLLSVDAEGVLSDLPGMATYHRYLFRDYIPRLKAQMYKHAFDRNLNRYSGKLTRDEIHLMTAKQANSAFGGLDPAFFEKLNFQSNRTYKAIEHMILFSPDFTKARAQFVLQGFGKYGQEQRMALIRGALVIYAGARIVNAILNNGDAKWKPQDAFSVVTPKSWGPEKRISLRTVQGDLMEAVTDPEHFSYNRINPVTLKPTIEFLIERDNFGRQESREHFLKDYGKQLTPIPVQKLFTTSDEGILSSIFTSAGLQTGNYRTPLEQMAHKLRIENIPDKPESEEKQDEGRRNVQMVRKIREGKATTTDLWNLVNQGKMTPREASAVMDRAQMTELQYDVHRLSLEDAMKIYAKADNSERAELHDILEEKRASGLKNMTDEAADKVDKQLKELGIE